ncbi:hypothetical protein S40285_10344 [Stachybotrys chlorohalonatus IBT 40285]|uniref:Uncharacterized protein n=1 Tax=Stachybotrys chlorohalonatus (strain IBT 40285) TaxID=1283841 RepID=A0A084QF55_STAC4|nr:hypothetical protein S40285_10344 [Stachybotrys chlorohalonata IBT 40285]
MGWVTVAVLVAYYFFAFDPSDDPFAVDPKRPHPHYRPNPIDVAIFKRTRRLRNLVRRGEYYGSVMERILNKCVLRSADAQLVTGIAIIVGGYSNLRCGISAYHWHSVVYLTWFSCLTHLSALSFLRRYFHLRPAARSWRLCLMTALVIMLIVAFIPTGHFYYYWSDDTDAIDWEDGYAEWDLGDRIIPADRGLEWIRPRYVLASSPAICFYKTGGSVNEYVSMIFSVCLLAYGYFIRAAKLFQSSSTGLGFFLHAKVDRFQQVMLRTWARLLHRMKPEVALRVAAWAIPFQTSLYFVLKMILDLYSSTVIEMLSLAMSALWGTLRLTALRSVGNPADNDWTFGQILPLLLMAAPLMPMVESLVTFFLTPRIDEPREPQRPVRSSDGHGPLNHAATFDSMVTMYGQQYADQLYPSNRAPPFLGQLALAETMVPRASNPEETLGQVEKHAEALEVLETCAYPDSPAAEEIVHLLQFGHEMYHKCMGLYPTLVLAGPVLAIAVLVLAGGANYLVGYNYPRGYGGQLPKSIVCMPVVAHIMGVVLFFTECWSGTAKKTWRHGSTRFLVCVGLGGAAACFGAFLNWAYLCLVLLSSYLALTVGCPVLMAWRMRYIRRRAHDAASSNQATD